MIHLNHRPEKYTLKPSRNGMNNVERRKNLPRIEQGYFWDAIVLKVKYIMAIITTTIMENEI